MEKNNNANTQVFYLHVAYLNCTHKYSNRFFESRYSFETFTGVLFAKFFVMYLFTYSHKHEKT